MSLDRLLGIQPGRVGLFSGQLSLLPAATQGEVAREVERLGYGTLWYGEALARESFVQASIFLCATERLVVASGIASIYARDPIAMTNGGRGLVEAWPRRFILGLGVSHAPVTARRGREYGRPVSTMRDYLERMDEAPWRGPEVEPPPRVLAALGPNMVALAAERTAGAYPYFTTVDQVAAIRQAMGNQPFLAADMPVVLAPDRSAARQIGDAHLRRYLVSENYRNNLLRLGWPAEELEPPGSDALFDAVVAWGSESEADARATALFRAGADQVALNIVTATPSVPYVDELRRLAFLASR